MSLFNNVKRALTLRNRRDPETLYLEEATSHADLEMRYREIDRGRFKQR